jgi:cation transport regulator ChaC
MTDFLFGYGSMMNLPSAGRALKREITPADVTPAYLHGYVRTWSLKERVRAESLDREITAVFLDLARADRARSNGVLIEVTPRMLEHLRRREKNYDLIDVTGGIEPGTKRLAAARVYTFVAKPEFVTRKEDTDLFVMEQYMRMIDEACNRLGPGFVRDYAASTERIPYPRITGPYVFVDQEQAKHV